MNNEVRTLLRNTTLRILDQTGTIWGTGFFIAPDLVMTAAHVLAGLDGQVLVQWDGGKPVVAHTAWAEPRFCPPGVDVYPAPDLAVLYVPAGAAFDHPCAMLDEEIAGERMLADGYTKGVTVDTATPDPVTARYDGIRTEAGWDLIKCADAIVDPGMSGAPLLDLTSGQVVGVVKAQRSPDFPNGFYSSSVAGLRICRPDVWATSQMFHQTDRRWRQAISPGSTVRDPKTATRSVLNATLAAVERRTWNLPPLVNRTSLHQTIWVRHIGGTGTESEKSEPGRVSTAERFRWRPLRELGHVTVVRGLPGYGKSWLLAYHAEAIAKDSAATLEAGGDARRLRLPLLLNCASLAAMLPTHPNEDDVVSALLKTADLPLSPQMVADECRNMTREAFSTGSLILCLDGLDEVPARFWSRLQRALGIIAAGSNTTLISTRHSALGLMEEVAEGRVDIEVLGFTSREASRFIAAWLERSPGGRGSLERALESSEALRAIASVPLFLSFLCRLAQVPSRSKPFPTSKALLYQEVVEGLLAGNWRTATLHDPDAPYQLERRLRALADSLGALLDSWRSSGESVSRAELLAELAKQPDYSLLRATAEARWETWQRANDAEPARTPLDPVLWEFIFDGLLIAESDAPEPTVRVLHPSLKEYLLSNYLSRMTAPAWKNALDRHRWFDVEWQEMFALASSMMPTAEADSLIQMILNVEVDPWLTQTQFAARCVAEGGANISEETATKVVLALLNHDTAHMSDRRRRDAAFARLVRAHVGPAVSRALEIYAADPNEQSDLYLEAVCALAEAQHEDGLRKTIEIFSDSNAEVPRRYRERLITALTVSEDPASLDLVVDLIDQRGRRSDLDAFLIALRSQSGILIDTAVRLLRTRSYVYSARAAVAAALLECGDEAADKVLEAAEDATLEWGLRSRLFVLLINADTPDVAGKAMSFLRNPSVRTLDRASVIEKLIRAGEISMLSNALTLLLDSTLPTNTTYSLVRAVRDIGTEGVKLLRSQMSVGLPLALTVPHLVVLIEMRDELGLRLGVNLSLDPGVPDWIRGSVLLALLRTAPDLVGETAMQVAGSPNLRSADRLELSLALARAGIRGAADAVRAALDDAGGVRNWPATSRVLAASGDIGRATLVRIAADSHYYWHIRTESVMALAAAQQEADVQSALAGISRESIPDLWRQRLVFGLTASGQPQFVAELIRFLPSVAAAYEIFYQFMQGPRAVLDIFFDNMPLLHDAMTAAPADIKGVILDDALLVECGLVANSESNRRQLMDWFHTELQRRAANLMNELMLPQQLDEYQGYIDDSDEKAALDWLNTNFPEYWDFVQQELSEIKEDVINGRVRLVLGIPAASEPPQSILKNLRVALDALVEMVEERNVGRDDYFLFLEENQGVLLTDYAIGLGRLAVELDPGWPLHEAHLFVLSHAREHGINATRRVTSSTQLIYDLIVELIDANQFQDAYLAVGFYVLRFPDDMNGYLYGAISAEGFGSHRIALRLSRQLGQRASDAQVLEADRIIREMAIRFDWPSPSAQALLDNLAAGHSEGPDDEAFHYSRGLALADREQYADAVASYDRAIELGANYPEVHASKAESLGKLGQHDEALAAYDRALALDPDNPNRHVSRSIVLHKLGRWEESLTSCKRAVELEPDSADWHNNEGEVLLMLGRLEEAKVSFRAAVNLSATAGVEPRVLLAALTRASAPEEAAELSREALRRTQDTVSAFRYGELRALAHLMSGNQDLAERELRSVAAEFSPRDLLEPQLYRLLRDPWLPGLERLLAIWKNLGVEELLQEPLQGRSEDDRTVVGDGDGVLDMGGATAIGAADGPAVRVDPALIDAAGEEPGLDGDDQAGDQA